MGGGEEGGGKRVGSGGFEGGEGGFVVGGVVVLFGEDCFLDEVLGVRGGGAVCGVVPSSVLFLHDFGVVTPFLSGALDDPLVPLSLSRAFFPVSLPNRTVGI